MTDVMANFGKMFLVFLENYYFEDGDFAFILLNTSNEKGSYNCPETDWLRHVLGTIKTQNGFSFYACFAHWHHKRSSLLP